MFRRILLFGIPLILCTTNLLYAFDNNRKGFILGLGVGFSSLSYTQELYVNRTSVTASESKSPFVTNFKIGGAPSNQVLIYWSSKVNWFEMQNALGSTSDMTAGYGTISVSYYQQPVAPSFYFSGGLGFSSWNASSSAGNSNSSGRGLMLGVGYEFSPHWCVELSLGTGDPSRTESGVTLTTHTSALMLTINGMLY